MKRVSIFLISTLLFGGLGCHRPITSPEQIDPVYLNLKKSTDDVVASITEAQKDLDKAKINFETAPIRTGQRQDAREDYFQAQGKIEKLIESYRFLALKTNKQLKNDRISYEKAFKDKKPWPNPDDVETYKVERHLADAPKEWTPENRIKKKATVAAPKEEGAE